MYSVPPVTTLSTRVAPFNPTVMISAEAVFWTKESRAFRLAPLIIPALILPVCSAVSGGKLTIGEQTTSMDLPACLTLCCVAVLPPLLKGKFYRWQGIVMLALYAAYVVMLVA